MSAELALDLRRLGNLPTDYRHHRRLVTSDDPTVFDDLFLKWYEISVPGIPAPEGVQANVRQLIRQSVESGLVPAAHGFGFTMLHHSTRFTYVIICVWHETQALWTAHFQREAGDADGEFERVIPGIDDATLCVWELAPVWHERQAWVRYLFSNRTEDDKLLYLMDQLSGTV